MARPREFEEAVALDAAVHCFWTRGFEATSIRVLAEEMSITGASLYNAFGDKRTLFRLALERYVEQGFSTRAARFEAQLPPREAIEAFFEEVIKRSLSDPERKGCLLVNSAIDLAPHDTEFRRVIRKVLIQVESFFRRCIEGGQRDGTIGSRQSAEDLARLLMAILLGMRVLARSRPEQELLEGLLRPVSALLDGDKQRKRKLD